MEQIPFQPIQLSSDTLTLNNTPSPIIDSDSQTDVFYAEDEIILKDKNICSFVNLPNETKSFLQLDRYDNSMQSSMFSGLTSWKNTPIAFGRNLQKITEEKLKSTLNKMYYRKAKVLLNERFGEGIDEENIEEFDFNDNGENSPKTTYEQEFNNPRKDSQMLYLEKKDRYEFLWTYKDLFPCLNLRITLMKAQ